MSKIFFLSTAVSYFLVWPETLTKVRIISRIHLRGIYILTRYIFWATKLGEYEAPIFLSFNHALSSQYYINCQTIVLQLQYDTIYRLTFEIAHVTGRK